MNNEMVDLNTFWRELQSEVSNGETTVEEFVTFMEDNSWFGMEAYIRIEGTSVKIPRERIDEHIPKILYYLQNHNNPACKKLSALKKMLRERYPHTAKVVGHYFEKVMSSYDMQIQIYDFMLAFLDRDISLYDNKEMASFVEKICEELTLNAGKAILELIEFIKRNFKTRYDKSYILHSRNETSRTKEAFDKDLYLRLVFALYSKESIDNNQLYQKIAKSSQAANALLYLSLHTVSALRDTDIERLPHPKLHAAPERVLEQIEKGELRREAALVAVNSVLFRIQTFGQRPNKTERFTGIPTIKLIIPESAMEHFGILFSAAEAHYQLKNARNRSYINPVKEYENIKKALGNEIASLFWDVDFSTRSANKTYMQMIEQMSDEILDTDNTTLEGITHAKGYMLAALARSHKGSYGEFASTTAIYLRDAKFSGYSPEFIARELFERGVCSFIPSMLLKLLYGKSFEALPVKKQTQIIKAIGLSPNQIENLLVTFDNSLSSSKKMLEQSYKMTQLEERKVYIGNVLHKIACGAAPAKFQGCFCLMTAVDKICPYPERTQCFGCENEITTKSAAFVMVKEYQRLLKGRESASKEVQQKNTALLRNVLKPCMEEFLSCIEDRYGSEAVKEMENVILEVIKDE